jgi:quercetin dioxygenase-like cupin family protein
MTKKLAFGEMASERVSASVQRTRACGEKLEVIRYEYAPGSRFFRHAHPAEQLTYVLRGALVFVLDDREERLEAGEAILIAPDEPHGAYVPDGAPRTETINVFTPVREAPPGG